MFRRESVRFLKTSDLSELRATLKIGRGDPVNKFQKVLLEYLEKDKTNNPAYYSENRNRFTTGKRTADLISLIEWDEKSLNTNTSHGIINAKIKGNYFIIEVQGDSKFVDHFYKFVQGP